MIRKNSCTLFEKMKFKLVCTTKVLTLIRTPSTVLPGKGGYISLWRCIFLLHCTDIVCGNGAVRSGRNHLSKRRFSNVTDGVYAGDACAHILVG